LGTGYWLLNIYTLIIRLGLFRGLLAGDFGELIAIRLYEKIPVTYDKYIRVV
jgi:hypothetical protein